MKVYYIKYPRNFANEYSLCWVEKGSKEEQEIIEQDWDRITRKEAIEQCVTERWRRKNDQAFSGYGDAIIKPYGLELDDISNYYTTDGYVYERL